MSKVYAHNARQFPEDIKRKAREILAFAVRTGAVERSSKCESCGGDNSGISLEAHHTNYFEPINVIWLCHTCHMNQHEKQQAFVSRDEALKAIKDICLDVYNKKTATLLANIIRGKNNNAHNQ